MRWFAGAGSGRRRWPGCLTGSVPGQPLDIALDLASRQHGAVSRRQLRETGLSVRVVEGLLDRQYLRGLHRGVYRVGAVAGPRAPEIAAVLACGVGSVVSHWSAGALWRLVAAQPPDDPVDVLVPWHRAPVRPGIRVHRARALDPDDLTTLDGVPVTRPARPSSTSPPN